MKPKWSEAEYLQHVMALGFSKKFVDKWLEHNPPSNGWQGGPYSWAYCEMPVW